MGRKLQIKQKILGIKVVPASESSNSQSNPTSSRLYNAWCDRKRENIRLILTI